MNRQADRTIIPVRHVIRRRLVLLCSVLLISAALTMSCSTSGDPDNEVNAAGTARVSGSRPAVVASTQPATAALHPRSAHSSTSTETYEVTPEGLTTAVNVPLEISEAELAQSCIDLQPTVMTFGGDVDAVLAMIQATAVRSWKNATPQEQAAIIAALRAAADGDC